MTYTPEHDLNHNLVSPDHRYGCHNKPYYHKTTREVQDGCTMDGKRIMVEHTTSWLPIKCGHSYRQTDPSCTSCYRR